MTTADKTAKKRRPKKSRCGCAAKNRAGHMVRSAPLSPFSPLLHFCALLRFGSCLKSSASAPALIDLAHLDLVVAYGSLRRIGKKKRLRPA